MWRCLHSLPPLLQSGGFSHRCLLHFDLLLFSKTNKLACSRIKKVLIPASTFCILEDPDLCIYPVWPRMVAWCRGPRPWASCWFTFAPFWSRNSHVTSEPWNQDLDSKVSYNSDLKNSFKKWNNRFYLENKLQSGDVTREVHTDPLHRHDERRPLFLLCVDPVHLSSMCQSFRHVSEVAGASSPVELQTRAVLFGFVENHVLTGLLRRNRRRYGRRLGCFWRKGKRINLIRVNFSLNTILLIHSHNKLHSSLSTVEDVCMSFQQIENPKSGPWARHCTLLIYFLYF